jgi:hypothetical protein
MPRITGIVCSPRIYSYKGWTFEINSASGPWPLRKGGELRARAGRVFWKVWSEFEDLTDEQKKDCRVGGGCVRF